MKLASRTEDCTRPMPRSVVSSVSVCASAWMRWSGFTPISPARPMRAARLRVIQLPIRSLVASSRSLTRISWLKPVCATLSTSRMPAMHEEDAELVQELVEVAPLDRVVERLVPGVEPHLHRGGGDDDQRRWRRRGGRAAPARRAVHRADQHADLVCEALVVGGDRGRRHASPPAMISARALSGAAGRDADGGRNCGRRATSMFPPTRLSRWAGTSLKNG